VALALSNTMLLLAPLHAQESDARCFPETGQCISGRVRAFWEQNGGLPVFGFPVSAVQDEQVEGKSFQVQWFERVRMELHPENVAPFDVLLGRLGAEQMQQTRIGALAQERQDGCLYFEQTSHSVCGRFAAAWQRSGLEFDKQPGSSFNESLALWGLPLSNEMTITLADGKRHIVQYFERARFEAHADNPEPFTVLFGLLGNERRNNAPPTRPQTLLPAPLYFLYDNVIVRLERDGLTQVPLIDERSRGNITTVRVSPAGDGLAYVLKDGSGEKLIYTDATGANRRELFTSTETIKALSVSPSGSRILFHTGELNREVQGNLWMVALSGGPPQLLLPDDNKGESFRAFLPEAWSPNEQHVLVSAVVKQSEGCAPLLIDLNGTARATPEVPEGNRWGCGGAWLPDNTLLLSVVPEGSPFAQAGLWRIEPLSNQVRPFLAARRGELHMLVGRLQTLADGTSSVFLLETANLPQLGDPRPFRYAPFTLTATGSPQRWLGNVVVDLTTLVGWAPDGSGFLLQGQFGDLIGRTKTLWVPLDGGAPYEINNAGTIVGWGGPEPQHNNAHP
jgi:hypothetical protein